ncbi:MAG: cytochrome c3 family protein [Bacteroidota bacterium]
MKQNIIIKNRIVCSFVFLVTCFYLTFLPVLGKAENKPGSKETSEVKVKVYTNKKENAFCLHCHGKNHVEYKNDSLGINFKQKMYQECVIDTALYYASNHWNFKCIDCHSEDYKGFPHNPKLRFEAITTCLDCHGDDPKFAKYGFEKIQSEYEKSVHVNKHAKEFNCWSCHDSHYYKINAGNRNQDLEKTIAYDNSICLSCHANINKYQLIADRLNPNVTQTHSWLPNQANHFTKVRCIECHTAVNDSMLVAHDILPKEKAVRKCVECHSTNSRLKASLYKYRLESGLMNDPVIGDAVLIGATRSTTLNLVGNIFFLLTLIGIAIHTVLRIVFKK